MPKNFREELYPEYKANRRRPAKQGCYIETKPIDGGWRSVIIPVSEGAFTGKHIIVYSPQYDPEDAQIAHNAAVAWAKENNLRIAEQVFSTAEKYIDIARYSLSTPEIRLYHPQFDTTPPEFTRKSLIPSGAESERGT